MSPKAFADGTQASLDLIGGRGEGWEEFGSPKTTTSRRWAVLLTYLNDPTQILLAGQRKNVSMTQQYFQYFHSRSGIVLALKLNNAPLAMRRLF
ncbi:MAG TPA: hypothetical protein VMW04_03285 [Patescibacteria group bacterium]|nr:hypothetical protein [Patescibacteria group bacterium]